MSSFENSSRGSSLSRKSSENPNPFQFFDRIDQEIEENKSKLKETVPIIRPVLQRGEDGKFGLSAEESRSTSKTYNAFFNIHFDQFSTKALSTPVPNTHTQESAQKKATGECPLSTCE